MAVDLKERTLAVLLRHATEATYQINKLPAVYSNSCPQILVTFKISEVDFFINGRDFKFYVKPYFLRLHLPGDVIENGRESATYDIEKGTFTVKLPKVHQGQVFEGLDMLTTLLAPRKKAPNINQPLVEVIDEEDSTEETTSSIQRDDDSDDSSDFDWEIEQRLPEDDIKVNLEGAQYGFGNQKSGVFERRQEELHEIADITNPESTTSVERRAARLMAEDFKFDPDHYLADYFDEESIQLFLAHEPPWNEEYKQLLERQKVQSSNLPSSSEEELSEKSEVKKKPKLQSDETIAPLTEQEKDKLRRLPNKEYLLDDHTQLSVLLGLVDIIFAYAYNHRTTDGENTVESPWTVNKISATLSWFETFTSLSDVITACSRRCLGYPLYRNWKLVQRVLDDTKKIFTLGRRRILKCLLEIHDLFSEDDPRYILNNLYITDYCVWIQSASNKKLQSLARRIQKIRISKEDLGWQLKELETAAILVQQEENKHSDDDSTGSSDSSESSSNTSGSEAEEIKDLETRVQATRAESSELSSATEENTEIRILNEPDDLQNKKITVLNSTSS